MEVNFRTSRLHRLFHNESDLIRTFGNRRAQSILARLVVLRQRATLSQVPTTPPERRHQLTGNRDEQYAIDIDRQYRLVFIPDHDPIPRRPDGGVDTDQVTAVVITEVIDYH
ncbi:MAG: system killer suppression protein [Chloroflexi bacterium]|nr:system killer suppression protein [Chloroflexota bacterium]